MCEEHAGNTRKDDAELLYYLGKDYNQLSLWWNECKDALQNALAMILSSEFKNDAERALATRSNPASRELEISGADSHTASIAY